MPAPSSSLATLRPDLASFLEYDLESDANGYVATQVLPVVNVAKASGNYGRIPIEQLLQDAEVGRNPRANYSRGNFEFDDASYTTREYGKEEVIDDNEAAMYSDYFNAEQIATLRAFSSVLRAAEQRVANAIFNTTTWSGAALYTDASTWTAAGTPLTDVEGAVQKVYDNSGLWPNAMIINRKTFRLLRNNTQVIDRIASSGAGNRNLASDVTVQMLAQAFDLDYIIVAGASRNTAKEGAAATPSQIWSSSFAMVCKIATGQDMREPCIGRTFHWSEDGSSIGGTVESYRDETVRGQVVRVRHQVAEVILYPEAGHLLKVD